MYVSIDVVQHYLSRWHLQGWWYFILSFHYVFLS